MDIRVRVEDLQPVTGTVLLDDEEQAHRFVGWLGLMQALADVLAGAVPSRSSTSQGTIIVAGRSQDGSEP